MSGFRDPRILGFRVKDLGVLGLGVWGLGVLNPTLDIQIQPCSVIRASGAVNAHP